MFQCLSHRVFYHPSEIATLSRYCIMFQFMSHGLLYSSKLIKPHCHVTVANNVSMSVSQTDVSANWDSNTVTLYNISIYVSLTVVSAKMIYFQCMCHRSETSSLSLRCIIVFQCVSHRLWYPQNDILPMCVCHRSGQAHCHFAVL